MQKLSDDELLERYHTATDTKYVSELFLRHADAIYRIALQFTNGNTAEAEDVVQITFIKFIRHYQQYQGGTNLKAWLSRIAINICRDKYKEEKQRRIRQEKYASLASFSTDVSNELEDSELQEAIKKSLQTLPEKYRTPMWMILYEGLSYSEASSVLALPERTLRTQISRGIERLKDILHSNGIQLNAGVIVSLISSTPLTVLPLNFKLTLQSFTPATILQKQTGHLAKTSRRLYQKRAVTKSLSLFANLTVALLIGAIALISFFHLTKYPQALEAAQLHSKALEEGQAEQELVYEWDFEKISDRKKVEFNGKWQWDDSIRMMTSPARAFSMFHLPIAPTEKMIEIKFTVQYLNKEDTLKSQPFDEIRWSKQGESLEPKVISFGAEIFYANFCEPSIAKYYAYKNHIVRIRNNESVTVWAYQDISIANEISFVERKVGVRKVEARYLEKPLLPILEAIQTANDLPKWKSSAPLNKKIVERITGIIY